MKFNGGPLDGRDVPSGVHAPVIVHAMVAPSPNPVDDTTTFWIDENGFPKSSIDPVVTTHRYRYERGAYEYEGARG